MAVASIAGLNVALIRDSNRTFSSVVCAFI